jgi:hypothetical protein
MDAGAISLPLAEKSSRISRQPIESGSPQEMAWFIGRSPGLKQQFHEGKCAEERCPMRVHSRARKRSPVSNGNIMPEPWVRCGRRIGERATLGAQLVVAVAGGDDI